jgi:hypothetical protein
LYFIFGLDASFSLALGIAFVVSGCLCILGLIYPYTVLRSKESERADEKINLALRQIENYVQEARALLPLTDNTANE